MSYFVKHRAHTSTIHVWAMFDPAKLSRSHQAGGHGNQLKSALSSNNLPETGRVDRLSKPANIKIQADRRARSMGVNMAGPKLFYAVLRCALFSGYIIGIVGCGVSTAKPEAEALAATYFSFAKSMSFDSIATLYDEHFYNKVPRSEWEQTLSGIWKKLGAPQRYELQTWKVNTMVTTADTGTFVTLVYSVAYERYPATETLTMFKPATGGPIRIAGHFINSNGLVLR